jgi:hypothetical protein
MTDTTAEASIEKLRSMLQPDGYDLVVAATEGDRVDLVVVAGDDACEECLVPKVVFEEIVSQHLVPAGLLLGSLTYPTDE